jgi:hypothetical protein
MAGEKENPTFAVFDPKILFSRNKMRLQSRILAVKNSV